MNKKYIFAIALSALVGLNLSAQEATPEKQVVDAGQIKSLTMEESTAAVSIITAEDIEHRTSKNIGNSILGQGNGLISLQGAGLYADQNPTFYVRGVQTLNGNNAPLILVDGIERNIANISANEVESVTVLKDAAAVALYGYRGTNGAIQITTKRGAYKSQKVKFIYDHQFNQLINTPKFVDGYNYGLAINEARINDGLGARYNDNELQALRDGTHPLLYPNVNWVGETFRNTASTDNFNVELSGGAERFRYFAMLDLVADRGFIKQAEANEGYSTQDKYVRGNMRMNLDIDLTPTTDVRVNIFGMLLESNRPGSNVNIWDMVYTVPSAAFPIRDKDGRWAGSTTWDGTMNPVAQSAGAAYYKNHTRALFTDITIKQDLSSWLPGLGGFVKVAYDNISNIYENHSKTYIYSVTTPNWEAGASAPTSSSSNQGADSAMGSGSGTNSYDRRMHADVGLTYEYNEGGNDFYSQLKWDYDYSDPNGLNNTIYRQNISAWAHYGRDGKYLADIALVASGSSRLAPGTKWAFSPTVSLGWIISKEDWMNSSWVNFLKLRASAGILNADYLPGDNYWAYYAQQYTTGSGGYPFDSSFNPTFGTTNLGQLATTNPYHETAAKFNFGVDTRIFNGLSVTADAYYQRRANIWVSSEGKYSDVLGKEAPYENGGIVDSWGGELGVNYTKTVGDFTLNLGGNLNYNRNKIIDMLEEPRMYENLVQTGNAADQLYGLKAIGYFKDNADIAASPVQTFTTVRPGDIKYEDVNGDNVIDANDTVPIGFSTTAPQLFFNFQLGAEWKGLGFYALFQGAGRYSAVLNTKSMYFPLVDNTNISQYYYDNRWTPANQDALFPRLSSQSNANNYRTNTVFLADRSFVKLRNIELYYNVPQNLLRKTSFVKGAKVYVRGNDLFSFDKMAVSDPEAYGVSQLYRSVVAGVSLTF